jgi:N-acetylglucosamine-6-sulfatase
VQVPTRPRPLQRGHLLGLAAAVIGLAVLAAGCGGGHPARPSIVVIQLDDQDLHDLAASYRGHPVLPNMRALMAAGVSFDRYYVSVPVCCPSRAALLTGRYARNNGVFTNVGATGGFEAFRRHDLHDNLAVWLQSDGYRTIHLGKFLNGYSSRPPAVPPGWSDWQTLATDPSTAYYYGYRFNDNGRLSHRYGTRSYQPADSKRCPHRSPRRCDYVTDVLTRKAVRALGSTQPDRPFYMQLDYTAPHVDDPGPIGPPPPPRYAGSLAGIKKPRSPDFDESDVSDKPAFVRGRPPLSANDIARIDVRYERRLEAERAVDDGLGEIVGALRRLGRLPDTYVFLTSDNGYFQGEHRFSTGKFLPYETANHMPLVVRGPGIPAGRRSEALSANVDLAPTFLQISGARPTRSLDGQSLLPFALDPSLNPRRAVLLEDFTGVPGGSGESSSRVPHAYTGIRVGPYKYIHYASGERELYDLSRDPYELRSLAGERRYRNVVAWMASRTRALASCSGASCRQPVGPIPKPLG